MVETTAVEESCRGCGVQAVVHGRWPVRVRDLPAAGRPVTLLWGKRLWWCVEVRCLAGTWSEVSQHIRRRASLTERARVEACQRVGEHGHVAAVAVGVGWPTIVRVVRDHGRPLIDDPARLDGVTAVGVDETVFLAATATHATELVTGTVDLTGHSGRPGRLLDVVEGRSATALSDWVSAREQAWREQVEAPVPGLCNRAAHAAARRGAGASRLPCDPARPGRRRRGPPLRPTADPAPAGPQGRRCIGFSDCCAKPRKRSRNGPGSG